MNSLGLLSQFRKPKNKKNELKYKINIEQRDSLLTFTGELAKEYYYVNELWMFSRSTERKIMLAKIEPSKFFSFQLHLQDLIRLIESNNTEIFDFYLKVSTEKRNIESNKLSTMKETAEFVSDGNGNTFVKYFIRFGQFQNTKVSGLQRFVLDGNYGYVYITTKGNLSFSYNGQSDIQTKSQIEKVKSRKNILSIEGKIFTYSSVIESGTIILKGRNTNSNFEFPIDYTHLIEETNNKYGLNHYDYKSDILFNSIHDKNILEEDIYDLFLKLKYFGDDEIKLIRVGRPTFTAKLFTKDLSTDWKNKTAIITPYYTFKQRNLSLEVFIFNKETYQYLNTLLKWAWLVRPFNRRKNIWIVGERPYKAQDTGYHFFKYMREKHPDKNVYYVMDIHSPEYKNVKPYGNVLDFKSKEHIWNTLMASKIISSHHADYLFPARTKRIKKAVKATKVFLQHGVMGTKNMVANYGKKAFGFDTDLFLVSSDFERKMIINDFGYNPNEVFVTGLSRFDELLNQNIPVKRQLLIIPTWRDWIVGNEDFTETEYFQRYQEIVFSERLHKMAKECKFEIVFCLHPNMQKYTPYFKNAPVKVISQGEVDVQSLLKESAMMLTDYSSVAFDFSFLHKPIIYYQFDRDRFIGKLGSHLDLDNDLPGDIVYENEAVLDCIEYYANNDFTAKEENIIRSNKFLKFRDRKANERIYEVIHQHHAKSTIIEKMKESELPKEIYKRLRKSRYYFPLMKLFYNTVRRIIPVDKRLILFESSIGKQYSDSPKYLYEEILRRNLPYKKVWVCNTNTRFRDPNTIKIQRHSPHYYYYLARAKYWVNNQNFPTYLKKGKRTTYLQTWHGTPLKKMLYNIENIQGRDEGYLERVSNATKSWDYLISPSPYATKAFKSAFRYKGEILEVGYPRNDLFYQENVEELSTTIKNRINIPKNKKVILYAPTFRDNQKDKKNFVFSLNLDFKKLYEELGDEYILLLRLHVLIKNQIHIPEEYNEFIYNVSNYSDIQELYLISDILMTDYSSVMFDFANTGRPILFYTYDLEDYRDNLRGFYMNLEEEAPGPLLKDTDDIINTVSNIDDISLKYINKYTAFKEKYCALEDGHASERVVQQIFER